MALIDLPPPPAPHFPVGAVAVPGSVPVIKDILAVEGQLALYEAGQGNGVRVVVRLKRFI
jgi:hypothetical protein